MAHAPWDPPIVTQRFNVRRQHLTAAQGPCRPEQDCCNAVAGAGGAKGARAIGAKITNEKLGRGRANLPNPVDDKVVHFPVPPSPSAPRANRQGCRRQPKNGVGLHGLAVACPAGMARKHHGPGTNERPREAQSLAHYLTLFLCSTRPSAPLSLRSSHMTDQGPTVAKCTSIGD
jgi:hypothetical protein